MPSSPTTVVMTFIKLTSVQLLGGFQILRVHDEGEGTVVDGIDGHIGAELAGLNVIALGADEGDEFFVEGDRGLGAGGSRHR